MFALNAHKETVPNCEDHNDAIHFAYDSIPVVHSSILSIRTQSFLHLCFIYPSSAQCSQLCSCLTFITISRHNLSPIATVVPIPPRSTLETHKDDSEPPSIPFKLYDPLTLHYHFAMPTPCPPSLTLYSLISQITQCVAFVLNFPITPYMHPTSKLPIIIFSSMSLCLVTFPILSFLHSP